MLFRSNDEYEEFEIEPKGIGESTRAVENRSMKAIYKLINTKLSKDESGCDSQDEVRHILIVSHRRALKILISSLLYGDAHPNFDLIRQGNASINILDYNADVDDRHNVDVEEADNINQPTVADNYNCNCESSQQQESSCITKKCERWVAQKLNDIDHVKGHVITR